MKFTIRELMLVTVIVALALGAATEGARIYWLEQKLSRAEFDRDVLIDSHQRFGFRVIPDQYGMDIESPLGVVSRSTFDPNAPPRSLPDTSVRSSSQPKP